MNPLNGTLIRARRHELGIAIGRTATATGIQPAVLRAVERNSGTATVTALTIGSLTRLADHLGLPLADLFTDEPAQDPFPATSDNAEHVTDTDIHALTGVLHRASLTGRHANLIHVADALGWTLPKVHATAVAASPLLHPAGLRVRIEKDVIHLTTVSGQREPQARYMVLRAAACGGTIPDHNLLHKIVTETVPLSKIKQSTITTMNTLIQQGLAQIDGSNLIPTEPVLDALDPQRIPPTG